MQGIQVPLFDFHPRPIWHDWLDKLWKDYQNGEDQYIRERDREKAAEIIEQFTVNDNRTQQILELCDYFEFPTVADFLEEWKEDIFAITLISPSDNLDEQFCLKNYPQMIDSRAYSYADLNGDLQAKIIFGNYQGSYLSIIW